MGFVPLWVDHPEPLHVYRLCVASIVITAIAAISGIATYLVTSSSLMLCFGLENCLDFLSSAVVLWRFYKPGNSEERIEMLKQREKRASVAISVILLLLGIGIVIMAMVDFTEPNEIRDGEHNPLLLFAGLSFLIFSVLTVLKFRMAAGLNSRSLKKDGICSLIGTLLSFALILTTIIASMDERLWWIDPLIAIVSGTGCFIFGLRSVLLQSYTKGIPIWSPQWWVFSRDTRDGDSTIKEEEMTDVGYDENRERTYPNQTEVHNDLDSTCDENMDDLTLASTDERNP